MSDEWSIRAVICVILTSFVAAMCLFIFGGVAYEHEHTKEIYYSKSICLVLTRGYQSYPYRVRASIYTRYGPIWSVQLDKKPSINATIESYERFSSIKEAMAATCVHMTKARHVCWFDSRKPRIVQWEEPSTRNVIILLVFGGLSLLIALFFLFLGFYLHKSDYRGRYASP